MTMREKIARTLFVASDYETFAWDGAPVWLCKRFLAMADGALAELETPTQAMIEAGYSALTDNKPDPADIYRAMIRAAGE